MLTSCSRSSASEKVINEHRESPTASFAYQIKWRGNARSPKNKVFPIRNATPILINCWFPELTLQLTRQSIRSPIHQTDSWSHCRKVSQAHVWNLGVPPKWIVYRNFHLPYSIASVRIYWTTEPPFQTGQYSLQPGHFNISKSQCCSSHPKSPPHGSHGSLGSFANFSVLWKCYLYNL